MTWNVRGGLQYIILSRKILGRLQHADIIAFTHTGIADSKQLPDIPGFRLVVGSARTYDAVNGGVAMYAKTRIEATMVCDQPEYGMAWLRMQWGGYKLHAGVCYMPPGGSSYYDTNEDMDLDSHFEQLHQQIVRYKAHGDILIMGDLNARTGSLDDRGTAFDVQDWTELQAAGIDIPADVIQAASETTNIAQRCSRDRQTNKIGKRIIQMCKDHGLIILNGRLPGDTVGQCTFFADGKPGQSLIDYYIATPGLAFEPSGKLREGMRLHVPSIESCPRRPCISNGKAGKWGKFDHVPVTLSVVLDRDSMISEHQDRGVHQGEQRVKYRWRDQHEQCYSDILCTNETVVGLLSQLQDMDGDAGLAEVCFTEAIKMAITCLHESVGGIIKHEKLGGERFVAGRPRNAWFDDACKHARREYRQAMVEHGNDPDMVRSAFRKYRHVTRAAYRHWREVEGRQWVESLRHNQKSFWGHYRGRKPASGGFTADEWKEYFEQLYKAPMHNNTHDTDPLHAQMFPDPNAHRVQEATSLNRTISVAEVQHALDKVARGKSPGVDGLPMEFFKCAIRTDEHGMKYNVLTVHITRLFNQVLKYGYPTCWSVGAIVPVPKPKGDVGKKDDHRGIAVGVALSKLYSMVLLGRMDKWAEDTGVRAQGQAGFRHGRGTPDNAFVLNHVIERFRSHKKPLHAAFIDFRKAYDCVNRALLWKCLASLGIHGRILDSLMEMYAQVSMCVRVGGVLSECFPSELGVKQGDPLSPLLFGILIDRMETFFRSMLPETCGVNMGTTVLQIMLYADDLILVAESATDLQRMLDLLQVFCTHNDLTVNVGKSKAMVFHPQFCKGGQRTQVSYNGEVMERVASFVYLGMTFDEKTGIRKAIQRGLQKARGAMFALVKRCNELGIHHVGIKCHLFDALLIPIINYGCEVWGPSNMVAGEKYIAGMRDEVEKVHLGFLRQCLGVRKSTSVAAIMFEMDRLPIALAWLKQVLRFWNKMMQRPDEDLVKIAMAGDMELADSGVTTCWVAHLAKCLSRYGFDLIRHGLHAVDVDAIMHLAQQEWWLSKTQDIHAIDNDITGLDAVRSVPDDVHDGFKGFTYLRWFADEVYDTRYRFWQWLHDKDQIKVVARFRLGSHHLHIEQGRTARPYKLRSLRTCGCGLGLREDEMHFMLECPHYVGVRIAYADITSDFVLEAGYADDNHMRRCMNIGDNDVGNPGQFWRRMAGLISTCMAVRDGSSMDQVV